MNDNLARYCSINLQTNAIRDKVVKTEDPIVNIIKKKPPNKIVREYIKSLIL